MKDSGIAWLGEVPEEWDVSKLKWVARIYNGNSISDSLKDNYTVKTNIPYIAQKMSIWSFAPLIMKMACMCVKIWALRLRPLAPPLFALKAAGDAIAKEAIVNLMDVFRVLPVAKEDCTNALALPR